MNIKHRIIVYADNSCDVEVAACYRSVRGEHGSTIMEPIWTRMMMRECTVKEGYFEDYEAAYEYLSQEKKIKEVRYFDDCAIEIYHEHNIYYLDKEIKEEFGEDNDESN